MLMCFVETIHDFSTIFLFPWISRSLYLYRMFLSRITHICNKSKYSLIFLKSLRCQYLMCLINL